MEDMVRFRVAPSAFRDVPIASVKTRANHNRITSALDAVGALDVREYLGLDKTQDTAATYCRRECEQTENLCRAAIAQAPSGRASFESAHVTFDVSEAASHCKLYWGGGRLPFFLTGYRSYITNLGRHALGQEKLLAMGG